MTAPPDGLPVTIRDIRNAAAAIGDAIEHTPTRHSQTLSQIAGCDVVLKFENLQFTASFKERGALNRLLALTPGERKRGVVAMSAGNHAQAVAYHAGRLGIPAMIVMPQGTPFTKVKHTKDFGADVVLEGATLSEAAHRARNLAAENDLTFLHPYDDPWVIAGQGTVGLELLAAVPNLDALLVPVGGGGLISGVAIAAKALKPDIDIYGVQSELYPSMASVLTGKPSGHAGQSIAEGIAVKEAGFLTRRITSALVKDILLVTESEIESAIHTLLEIEKTLVEGAAAAGFAAVLAHRETFVGCSVGLILSGGNIDMRLLSNVILRELTREGRIQSLVIAIEDRPGFLARVAGLVSQAGGNILDVSHNRMMPGMPAKSAGLGMTIEARDATHAGEIRHALRSAGFSLMTPTSSTIGLRHG